jgi:hypothetical protein
MLGSMATLSSYGSDSGWHLEPWQEGVTSARIVWRDREDGTEHESTLTDEETALIALTWARDSQRVTLISVEVRQ